jgi:hypothetical protein
MTWTTESYFSKAQIYWEKATSCNRNSDNFLLNVCFTMEFIARGAVCHVNPTLNAASDQESLLFACGQIPRNPAKTADFRVVLERLQRLMPKPLSKTELANIVSLMEARNAELHSDTAEMSSFTDGNLMPSIYAFFVKVTEFSEQSIEALLGKEDATLAKQTAEALAKDRSKRVKDLINICKDRFFSLPADEQQTKREATTTTAISAVLTSGHHIMYLKYPACAQKGQLVTEPVGRSAPFLREEELLQEVRVIPQQFICKCCGLEIIKLDEIMAAGFSHEYCSIDDVDPIDHFNIDPLDHIDHEAVAREYNSEMYEYQDE